MNKNIFLLSIFLVVCTVDFSFGQFVRKFEFRNERQRRTQYALDDWISYLQSNHVTSVAVGTNYIYFGTLNGGILRYELFQNFWDYPFTTSNGLPSNRVLAVAFDNDSGYLWAVTDEDTSIFQPAEKEWLSKSQAPFWNYKFPGVPQPSGEKIDYNTLYPAQFLNLLPQYFANGPYSVTGTWVLMDDNFDEYQITGFLKDNWERMWFLIEDLGIGIGNTFSQRIDVVPYGLSHIKTRDLAYQGRDLWIGGLARESTGRQGIVQWKDSDGSWAYYRARFIANLPSDNVVDIAVTGDSVWFATDYGLSLYDKNRERWKNFSVKDGILSDEVLDLMIYDTTLYIGTHEGLNLLYLPSGKIKRVKDSTLTIYLATIYQLAAQENVIWAATNRGILRHKIGQATSDVSLKWEVVMTTAPIQDLPVTAVNVFKNEVWFASPGGVFWLDTDTGKWGSFPQISGDVSGPFVDIAVNDKSVWVSSPDGLLKFDRQRQYWRLYTTEDGLLNNHCYRLLLDGDYIWVANDAGITQFYWNNPNRID